MEYYNHNNYDPSLNIIGSYKLRYIVPWSFVGNGGNSNGKPNHEVCNTCNSNVSNTSNDGPRPNQRDDGFSLLSNRENVVQYLKKTKFCKILIDKGVCGRDVCNFAHSMSEMVFPNCAFNLNCHKKDKCMFKHPHETLVEYKERIQFKIPPNISVY